MVMQVNITLDDEELCVEVDEEQLINRETEPAPIIVAGYVQSVIVVAVNAAVVW